MKLSLLSTALLLSFSLHAQLVINEIASNNPLSYADEDGEYPDWIEIYNAGIASVNTAGYGLTDNLSIWNQWLLPSMSIAPGQRKIIFASAKNRGCLDCLGGISHLHTNFKISTSETIGLFDASGILLDSVTVKYLHAGHTMARLADGASWCYTDSPTPNAANTGDCYSGYAPEPTILTAPGFYAGSIDVEISGSAVHYTTDGNWPDAADNLYTAPVTISSNTVVKAVGTEIGKLPSNAATGSYFINETTTLPVISLSGRPCDIFNVAPCYIGAYDNVFGWEPDNPQVPGTVEYFSADHEQRVSEDIKFEVAGNSSIAVYNMRSLQFTSDEDFNSNSEIQYNIFKHDKPELDSLQGFRLRADLDWGNSDARMKDLIVNRIALPTHAVAAAYQNVAAFINGDYWGHYSAREELDKYFLRNNFGCNIDSVVLIRSGAGEDVWDVAEAGSITEYNNLKTFFNTHPMSNADNYAQAKELVDIENWVDYWAVQVFVNNDETAYNIRCFKSFAPDIKWRMMLWDCGAGSEGESVNSLTTVMEFVYTSDEVTMMNDLLDNDEFRSYFINRYADLLNTAFQYSRIEALIDEDADEIEDEMPAQVSRWGYPSTTSHWSSGVAQLKGFYDNRVFYQRNDIENYFDMTDQVDVTLDVTPPGAGYIKISTIVPDNLPWTGVYFDGNPVTVTAIANPGFEFVDWATNAFIIDPASNTFTSNISDNTTFTANFSGSAMANPVVISEVNYNSDSTQNGGNWIELHNGSGTEVNVGDYTFSNKIFYNDFKIPLNTVISPYGYLVVAQNKTEFSTEYPLITNVIGDFTFDLHNEGDSLTLKDIQGNALSAFKYANGRPWPYTAAGYGRTMELGSLYSDPNLPSSWFEGCVGGSPGEAYQPCYENPLIDEINYKSSVFEDAGDWFEIYNYSPTAADISGWILKDRNGNAFKVPNGTSIAGDGYIVCYQDATKFNTQFPSVINKVGPLNFGFDGQGDVILIYDETGKLFQSVGFDDASPYPTSPDGGGTALQIVNVALNINSAANWTESCPEGTPGEAYVTPCATDIANNTTLPSVYLYPNPATNFVMITLPGEVMQSGMLYITDASGKKVWSQSITNGQLWQIDISNYPAGIYNVMVQDHETFYTSTFVKS